MRGNFSLGLNYNDCGCNSFGNFGNPFLNFGNGYTNSLFNDYSYMGLPSLGMGGCLPFDMGFSSFGVGGYSPLGMGCSSLGMGAPYTSFGFSGNSYGDFNTGFSAYGNRGNERGGILPLLIGGLLGFAVAKNGGLNNIFGNLFNNAQTTTEGTETENIISEETTPAPAASTPTQIPAAPASTTVETPEEEEIPEATITANKTTEKSKEETTEEDPSVEFKRHSLENQMGEDNPNLITKPLTKKQPEKITTTTPVAAEISETPESPATKAEETTTESKKEQRQKNRVENDANNVDKIAMKYSAKNTGNYDELTAKARIVNENLKTEYSSLENFVGTYAEDGKLTANGVRQMSADFKINGVNKITAGNEEYNIRFSDSSEGGEVGTDGNDIIISLEEKPKHVKATKGNDLYLYGNGKKWSINNK